MTSSCLATIPAKKMVTPIDLVTLDLNLAFRPRLRQIEVLGYFRKRKTMTCKYEWPVKLKVTFVLDPTQSRSYMSGTLDATHKFTPSPLCEVVGKKPGLCHGAWLWVSVTRVYFATRKVTGAIRIVFRNLYWPLSKIWLVTTQWKHYEMMFVSLTFCFPFLHGNP